MREFSDEAERRYDILSALTPSDILAGCGFYVSSGLICHESKIIFHQAIVDAIKNPVWLLKSFYNKVTLLDSQLPVSQNLTPSDVKVFRELQRQDRLFEFAGEIERGRNVANMSAIAVSDIVARAIEIMGENYPNLMMFRGTSFDLQTTSYMGWDFAPANLISAIKYSNKNALSEARKNPVIVMLRFKDLGRLFSMHKLWIRTEGEWWRDSLEIHFYDEEVRRQSTIIKRLPSTLSEIDALLQVYKQRAIELNS